MPRKHLAVVAALVVTAALAFMASATSAGTAQSRGASAANGATQIATVSVQVKINRFVRRGHRLYAVGTTVARFAPTAARPDLPTAVDRKPFMVRVRSVRALSSPQGILSAQRICPILELRLAPTHLNLLGLIVDLSEVHLVITADSNGGLLGRLLCSLGGHRPTGRVAAHKLTQIAHRSGLSTRGVRVAVPIYQTASGAMTTRGSLSPTVICPILDLTLGPLDLNLLGLIVHLDQVHLTIVADSEGGILGQLLAGLLCPPPPGGGRIT